MHKLFMFTKFPSHLASLRLFNRFPLDVRSCFIPPVSQFSRSQNKAPYVTIKITSPQ